MKRILFLALICICTNNLISQNIYLGAKSGFTTYTLFPQYDEDFFLDVSYSFGLVAEYIPPKAFLSITSEFQYLSKPSILLFPLSLNLVFGDKVMPRVFGGLVPLIRVNPVDPNVIFGVGAKTGLGVAFRINNKLALSSDIYWCFLPERHYHYNHFAPADIDRGFYRILNSNIGIGYYIGKD